AAVIHFGIEDAVDDEQVEFAALGPNRVALFFHTAGIGVHVQRDAVPRVLLIELDDAGKSLQPWRLADDDVDGRVVLRQSAGAGHAGKDKAGGDAEFEASAVWHHHVLLRELPRSLRPSVQATSFFSFEI